MEYFVIRNRKLWGDYGSILISGFVEGGDYAFDGKPLELVRTGPFVPPIFCIPLHNLAVTDAIRKQISKDSLGTNIKFRKVVFKKVVAIPWHTWDQSEPMPPQLPSDGEPESYILAGKHSAKAAASIGKLWEVFLPDGGDVESFPGSKPWKNDFVFMKKTWTGEHLFKTQSNGFRYATTIGRAWLEKYGEGWLRFEKVTAV